MTRIRGALLVVVVAGAACAKAPPPDPLCSVGPIPSSTRVESGQGAVLIDASTEEYAQFKDPSDKQVASARVGQAQGLAAGAYRAAVNNSVHEVFVQANMLTRCLTSTLNVTGPTEEYYYVFDPAGSQLTSARLNKAVAIFPGRYEVRVNSTRAAAELKAREAVEIKAGSLQIVGATDEYYYVLNAAGTQLSSARLNAPMSVLAGEWTIKVNNTKVAAKVEAGQPSRLETGTVVVQGATEEYYYVYDAAGTQLTSARLNTPVAVFPGDSIVRVNNTTAPAKVSPGGTLQIATGALLVNAPGDEYYYVLDSTGKQLASGRVNTPVSLMAGDYTVRVGQQTKPASVVSGQKTAVAW